MRNGAAARPHLAAAARPTASALLAAAVALAATPARAAATLPTAQAPAATPPADAGTAAAETRPAERLDLGRLGVATIVHPPEGSGGGGGGAPARFVLLIADAESSEAAAAAAQALAREGAVVVRLGSRTWTARASTRCLYPAGELEAISQHAEKELRLPQYLHPVIVGLGDGAALAYLSLVQAPAGTFTGAVGVGFEPRLPMRAPLCRTRLKHQRAGAVERLAPAASLDAPWRMLEPADAAETGGPNAGFAQRPPAQQTVVAGWSGALADVDAWLPAALAAVRDLAPPPPPSTPPEGPSGTAPSVEGLPLVEATTDGDTSGDTFALLISGDGGWAGIDQAIAEALNRDGIPVVGLDSLRYFWTARTPEQSAADVARAIEHYRAAWDKQGVVLVGFSRGADVLIPIVNRLPAPARSLVQALALVSPGRSAEFEIRVGDFFGAASGPGALPLAPELARLGTAVPLVCIYGSDEADESLCTRLPEGRAKTRAVQLEGGHHFGGDYDRVAQLIVGALPKGEPPGRGTR